MVSFLILPRVRVFVPLLHETLSCKNVNLVTFAGLTIITMSHWSCRETRLHSVSRQEVLVRGISTGVKNGAPWGQPSGSSQPRLQVQKTMH